MILKIIAMSFNNEYQSIPSKYPNNYQQVQEDEERDNSRKKWHSPLIPLSQIHKVHFAANTAAK